MNIKSFVSTTLLFALVLGFSACSSRELNTKTSFLTGWKTFDNSTINFQSFEGNIAQTPEGMLPIMGGAFTIGHQDEF